MNVNNLSFGFLFVFRKIKIILSKISGVSIDTLCQRISANVGILEEFDLHVIFLELVISQTWGATGSTRFFLRTVFPSHVNEKKENDDSDNDVDDDDDDNKQSARREECTLSARGARRDWRERIEAACYAGRPNRAGRVPETGRRSILFFSIPFLAPSALAAHSRRGGCLDRACTPPTRSSSALVLPSGDIECRVNGTRSIRYEFRDA